MSQSQFQSSPQRETLILLALNKQESMLNDFPTDDKADITIILSSTRKNYRLQKKNLRKSNFFKDYFTDDRTCDSNIMLISKKYDPVIFDNVLKCFYGGNYVIYRDQDFYTAFHICAYLKIDSFLNKMEQVLVEDFSKFSFILVYQLGEMYQLMSVKSRCLDFLESDPNAFRRIFNFNQIQCHYIKTKQLFGKSTLNNSQYQASDKPPTNILLLLEDTFKNLIKIHNEYKQVQMHINELLPYEEIYKILKLYIEVRTSNFEECKERLQQLVVELIDKNWLSAKQYRVIYHQELLNEHRVNDISSMSSLVESFDSLGRSKPHKDKKQVTFDPLVSENYLIKKELLEAKHLNEKQSSELSKVRETLEKTMQSTFRHQQDTVRMNTQYEQLDKKFKDKTGYYEKEIKRMRIMLTTKERQLQEKESLIEEQQQSLEELYQNQNNKLDLTVESVLQVVRPPKLQQSEILQEIQSPSLRKLSIQNEISSSMRFQQNQRRIIFDQPPRCVASAKETDCLLEFFQVSIFEKINLKLLYRGSHDGLSPSSLLKQCRFQNDIIILFRTSEQIVFGVYFTHEIRTINEQFSDPRAFLFSVTHEKKMKQVQVAQFSLNNKSFQLGKDLTLFEINECQYPIDFEGVYEGCGPEDLVGDQQFELDEVEVYKINISRAMDY